MWCCGKVDVIVPAPPSDKLKVDVAVVAKPIVLVSRAPDLENQIVVVKKEAEAELVTDALTREEELTVQTINALLGIVLIVGVTYLAFNAKVDESFYIDAPHDL